MIEKLKFIKAAYGYENHHRCAFNHQGLRSFEYLLSCMNTSFSEERDKLWIAIYIPHSAMAWRTRNNLTNIRKFAGHIAAFQEVFNTPDMNNGYDKQWPLGLKAGRIFRLKEPCLELRNVLSPTDYRSFMGYARRSSAMELGADAEKEILRKISETGLLEVPFTKLEN